MPAHGPVPAKTPRARPSILTQLQNKLRERIFAASFYHRTLRAKARDGLTAQPADPWRGDAALANALFQGRYRLAGSEVQLFNRPPWTAEAPSLAWQLEASAFAWLRDFRAEGGEAARGAARELIATWIETFGEWHPTIWRADVLGRRLMAWASHADYLLAGADAIFRRGFLISLERQARHLLRAVSLAPEGAGRIAALCGAMLADAALGGLGRRARGAVADLEAELREQILPDGCHITRNPSQQMLVLRDLVWLRAGLTAARAPVPLALHGTIERMATMLTFLRHGDGALALFHGGVEEDRAIVAETIALATPASRAERTMPRIVGPSPDVAQYAGYERLTAGTTLVLVDTGAPPPEPFAKLGHASTLAFELSVGRERMVVNCGHRTGERWNLASRSTAAHSTAIVADANSTEVLPDGLGARPVVTVRRQEDEGNIWLDADHDGYAAPFGVRHRRRVYLSAVGDTFRGEDTLEGTARDGTGFVVRFHLHPDVQASLLADGALLRLANGEGWRFRAGGAAIGLEESIYLGQAGELRRAEQIVLTGTVPPAGVVVKWAFGRIETAG